MFDEMCWNVLLNVSASSPEYSGVNYVEGKRAPLQREKSSQGGLGDISIGFLCTAKCPT